MHNIRGIIFLGACNEEFSSEGSKNSLSMMVEQSACNSVEFVISAIQDNAQSVQVRYKHSYMPDDKDIIDLISYAQKLNIKIILKLNITCLNGQSQSEIRAGDESNSFISNWFYSYTDFILHYAKLAQRSGCDMLVIGSGLDQIEQFEVQWRNLIGKVRCIYQGLLSYDMNFVNLTSICWWNDLDYISANGYFELHELQDAIKVIKGVTNKFQKPFIFSEVGCKSCDGSSKNPGNYYFDDKLNLEEQSDYLKNFIEQCNEVNEIQGILIWNWKSHLEKKEAMSLDRGYEIYGKPSCKVIKDIWLKERNLELQI